MAKLRSKAQITQTLGLSKARNATCDLVESGPFLCSPVPKTRRQIDSKKFTDENLRLKKSIKALEKNLLESGAQIAAHALDLEAKDRTILDLQANLERSNSAARILNQKYLEIVKSLETVSGDLKNVKKRTQRLIHDRQIAKAKHDSDIQKLVQDHQMAEDKHTTHIRTLTANINETSKSSGDALTALSLANELIEKFKASLNHEKTVSTELRKKAHRFDMQRLRAQESLKNSRCCFKSKASWSAKKGGVYTAQARRLARELLKSGCSSERVGDAILACAKAFGIKVKGKISGRTVLRARDEGGFFGFMQLGREITHSAGFGESTDGTAHRKITYEAHHVTLAVPSYEPGIDDSDTSTWTNHIRFVQVEPALDHTAKTQFEGSKDLASKIAMAYSESPLSERDGMKMETNDWVRKEEFQNMDHAADGKKKFKLTAEWKEEVICEDLGEKAMDEMDADEIMQAMLSIPQEDIDAARAKNPNELISAATKLLERKLGKAVLDALGEDEQKCLVGLLFAGCGGHKDLNSFKYGVLKMNRTWETAGRPPPVLLANKANDTVIRLGEEADSAAVQRAVDSSSRGGVKLVSLAGALFNHKSEEQGYQDVHRMFMAKHKKEKHGITNNKKFPDSSNTRYQSHSYGSAELVTFLDLYNELLEVTRDSKKQAGFNHLEQNVAKGLEDAPTLTEMVAMSLYGVSVSWPYLNIVRGAGGKVVNLLDPDIIDLHRRLPAFCDYIAENPRLLLDATANDNFSKITLDGETWRDEMLIMSTQILASELPDLELMISAMFSGSADGWRQFTQEFVPGGPIDQLTTEQRSRIFIPATNDSNEGALGSWRVHARFHPNGTATGFSNKARAERNNTEMFIDKLCTDHDQLYVMRQVRVQGSSGENAKFREHLLKAQQARASATRKKVQDGENKKRAEISRLTAVGLIVDRVKISKMTVPQLNDQLSIHRKFLNDEVLLEVPQKDIKYKFFKLTAVLAAITRNEEKIGALRILIENMQESVASSGNLGESEPIDDENQQDSDEEDEESYEQDFD